MPLDTSPEALAEELLGRSFEDLDESEQRALQRVASSKIELDDDEHEFINVKLGDRVADRVARVGGSWGFIIVFGCVLFGWMLINSAEGQRLGTVWDPYPYVFLNLMLSTVAAFQAPVIMMSQNREAKKDRISNRHDYEVNLRTTVELLKLHRKMDVLIARMSRFEQRAEPVISNAVDEANNKAD
ncbi:DUF1003 domain-containing protein [Novosphingobium sp.]|uniref:DUF1003 domain-containing protein n=1 Tax=Novosphingobium sp. TaxID=1874826 RepID=UPI0025FD3DBE|nr:DUF1003 domain-containing protein [Novosphingobium sp.]